MSERVDHVVRVMTNDGGFRAIAADTTSTVREALSRQRASGATREHLGDLVTGAVLVREAMAPTLRAQVVLRGTGGRLVADAQPDGGNRGLVQLAEGSSEVTLRTGALLQVSRSLPGGAPHQASVSVPEGGGIADALMRYLLASENVKAMVAVATVMDGDEVVVAGGYLVQVLPEATEGPLMVMGERLTEFASIHARLRDERPTPDALLGELLYAMDFTRLESSALRFECGCSEVRVVTALSTLGRAEIEELVSAGEVLEIKCEYCGKDYAISPVQLRGLLGSS